MANLSRVSSGGASAAIPSKREYRSPLREQQAAQTRSRIVAAAAECFATHGYARTTLALIGRTAGVSSESVAANGPKAALLIAAFEHAFGGREGADPLSERTELQDMFAIEDVEAMLAAFSDFIVAGQAAGIGLWRALSAAALDDDAVAALYRELMERRLADNRLAVDAMAARGLLRRDKSVDELAGALAFLNGFEPYQVFVSDFGWSEVELKSWYIDSVRRTILDLPDSPAR
ncbi:TetR/AcrR family transcriptional regulator [Herbiconiux sp. L3-i23]|uniref:TetR/AcrR family transcriptional regulator n=1 Tax=Herbiconiux sp. L3-i23 TaxID=2905871 RepID=UPI002073AA52|nr:TetR/AcrR family transcriptional regulator [Herbiconiux sp. L3-i23]